MQNQQFNVIASASAGRVRDEACLSGRKASSLTHRILAEAYNDVHYFRMVIVTSNHYL